MFSNVFLLSNVPFDSVLRGSCACVDTVTLCDITGRAVHTLYAAAASAGS